MANKKKSYYKLCPFDDISYAAVLFAGKRLVFLICSDLFAILLHLQPLRCGIRRYEHNILDTIGMCFIIDKYIVSITYRIKVFAAIAPKYCRKIERDSLPRHSIERILLQPTNQIQMHSREALIVLIFRISL